MTHRQSHNDYLVPGIVFVFGVVVFSLSLLLVVFIAEHNLSPVKAKAGSGFISWPIFDGGADDPGNNTSEAFLSTANVSGLQELWSASLPISADDAVVEQANVSTTHGVMNLVFVNTVKGNLIAYNAYTGAKIWEADPSTADYNGQGTKSSPAIDPSGNYIYAYAVDGYIHKYNIATGTEVTGNGFPAQVTLLANNIEKGSSSINIANGYLYMTTSGNDGDYGHYDGHVIAVNLSTGVKTVWNSQCSNITQLLDANSGDPNYCSNTESGIWARPGVKVDPITGNVFVATGNGLYDANSGGHEWGDSIIELKPDLSSIVDSYTPTTYASLQSSDADLGSTAPVLLPTVSGSNTPYMLVQAGKDHIVRLLNRSNLSGQSAPGHTGGELQKITISDEVHEQPAVWTDSGGHIWVFVTDESGDLYAYKLVTTSGTSTLVQQYTESIGTSSSPFIANGVMYIDGNSILALNPSTGAKLFDSSSIGISLNQHWESPVVVNGILTTPDDNGNLYALYLPGVTPSSSIGSSNLQYRSAFQANTGTLYTFDGTSGAAGTSLGIATGTNPSIGYLSSIGYESAFQANTGNLYTYDSTIGAVNRSQGMKPGTNPSIATSPSGGWEIAFQSNTGLLYTYNSSTGAAGTTLGMAPNTSPSITYVSGIGYEVAFQANTGDLYTYDSGHGAVNRSQGMASGTSPSIASAPSGGYEVAFQTNANKLYTFNSSLGAAATTLGMAPGTSPSIAYGYQVAFQANTGNLYTFDTSNGADNTQQGMRSGTSPSIGYIWASSRYEVAFQANSDNLYAFDTTNGAVDTSQGMSGTSPAIAAPLD